MPINTIKEFLHKESSGGLLIMGAAVLAILSAITGYLVLRLFLRERHAGNSN